MNFKTIKTLVLFTFIFVSSGSFAQYKYDIGLKASTYDLERFQLDARFHFDSPYSLVFSVANGSSFSGNYAQTPIYNDSLISVNQTSYNTTNSVFKIGVQRKLGFLATDVFYAGATVGFGFNRQRGWSDKVEYVVEADSMGNLQNPMIAPWEYQSSTYSESLYRAINFQLGLSFGMDVPISKRFSINAEIGLSAIYDQSLDYSFKTIYMGGSISGGVRYAFGKRAE